MKVMRRDFRINIFRMGLGEFFRSESPFRSIDGGGTLPVEGAGKREARECAPRSSLIENFKHQQN